MLELEFQLTLEDYHEACIAHYAHAATRKRGIRSWVVSAVLVAIVAAFLIFPGIELPFGQQLSRAAEVLAFLVPIVGFVCLTMGTRMIAAKGIPSVRVFLIAFIIVTATIGVGCFLLLHRSEGFMEDGKSFLGLYAWILLFIFWYFVFRAYLGSAPYRAMWDGLQYLHSPKTAKIDEHGLTMLDPLTRLEYRWPAITRFTESNTLFLFYLGDHSFHLIPKRALSENAVGELRSILERYVAGRTRAFPVLPVETSEQSPPVESPQD